MAEFTPDKLNISEINGGEQYGKTIVQANEFNSIIEGVLYSQDGVTSNTKDINNLYAIVDSGSLVTKTEVEDSYLARKTGGDLDIIDGALTRVEKIEGDTIKCENVLKESITTVLTNTHNGITYTYDTTTGVLTANGTSTGVSLFYVTKTASQTGNDFILGGTYTASIVDGSTSSQYLEVEWRNIETKAWVGGKQVSSTPVTFTVPNDCLLVVQVRIPAGVTVSNKKIYVMLNRGSTAIPYQPFFSGLVSTSFKGIKTIGRNLFDIDKLVGRALVKNADGTYTMSKNGNIRFSNVGELIIPYVGSNILALLLVVDVLENTTTQDRLAIRFYYADGTTATAGLGFGETAINGIRKSVIRADLYIGADQADGSYIKFKNPRIGYRLIDDVQVSGYDPTYEPYKEDTSFSLDNAVTLDKWDYIDVERKKLVRKTGVLVLNGSEAYWGAQSTADTNGRKFMQTTVSSTIDNSHLTSSSIGLITDKEYVPSSFNTLWGVNGTADKVPYGIAIRYYSGSTYIYVSSLVIDNNGTPLTPTEWRDYLAINPITVKYEMATPIETDIDIPDDYVARLNGVELIDDTGRTYTDLMVANNSVPKPKITQTYYTKV